MFEYHHTSNKSVCHHCIGQPDLKSFIKSNRTGTSCSYCGKTRVKAINIVPLAHYIEECWRTELESPEDAGVPWDSREGGWLMPTYYATELLNGEGPIEGEIEARQEVVDDLNDFLGDSLWAPSHNEDFEDRVKYTWELFKAKLRHEARFMVFHSSFKTHPHQLDRMDFETPLAMLGTGIEWLDLLTTLPTGTVFYRARQWTEEADFNCAEEMGPPKKDKALKANRMSPVGIPMFYGSESEDVCQNEIDYDKTENYLHIAGFSTLRQLKVVDFTKFLGIPSIYSPDRHTRSEARIIHDFLKDMTAPLIPSEDKVDHIEYIPTQAVAEWLRYGFRVNGKPIDGILYKSTQGPGTCCVLFIENEHCVDDEQPNRGTTPTLRLASYRRIDPQPSPMP